MGLDVYLELENEVKRTSGIFIREDGGNVEISREEWDRRFPDREPAETISKTSEVFTYNVTHNLAKMAGAAGIYKYLWRPDEVDVRVASQLKIPLQKGLEELNASPEKYREFNPSNGWGSYEGLVEFIERYLDACKEYPEATVIASR